MYASVSILVMLTQILQYVSKINFLQETKSVWEKSPFLANFRLLLKRKILLNQGLLIPRFSRIS